MKKVYVTDGLFLFRSAKGELFCIWSSFNKNGYVELISKSDSGDIDGIWTVCDRPLFEKDGGHGMVFKDLQGNDCFIMP